MIRHSPAPKLLACLLLLACLPAAQAAAQASTEESAAGSVQHEPDGEGSRGVHDPWEPLNRRVFAFNEFADRWVLEPVATGWDTVMPEPVQEGIDNFFDNLGFPSRFVNDWLQGKPEKAGDDMGRFLMNTLFGLAGLFDPATAAGIPAHDEDFGQTLGVWGVPPGPYLVLPFLGASNPRDTGGLVVEGVALTPQWWFVPIYVSYPAAATRVINGRSLALESVAAERASAFDFYAAVRSAAVQYRANQVRDRADEPEEEDEDFYYFDEDEE